MKSAVWLLASAFGVFVACGDARTQTPPLPNYFNPQWGRARVIPQLVPKNQEQSPDALHCAKTDSSPEARVAACGKLIGSGNWKGKNIAWAYANRCIALDTMGKLDEAFPDCVEAIKLDPDNAAALQIRADILQNRGDTDQALADYDKAIELGANNASVFSSRGTILLAQGEADKALADYNRALEINGKSASAFLDRGSAWLAKGDADQALVDYGKAIEIAPDNPLAWSDQGDALMAKGDKAKAADAFKQALKLNSGNAYAALWLFLSRDGAADAQAELRANSAKLSQSAWPWPVVQFYLGSRNAQEMLAAAKTPGDQCEAQFYLGEERLLKKAVDEALPLLRKAVETCPKNFAEYFQAVSELKTRDAAAGVKTEAAPKGEAAPAKEEPSKADAAPTAESAPKTDAGSDSGAKPQQ